MATSKNAKKAIAAGKAVPKAAKQPVATKTATGKKNAPPPSGKKPSTTSSQAHKGATGRASGKRQHSPVTFITSKGTSKGDKASRPVDAATGKKGAKAAKPSTRNRAPRPATEKLNTVTPGGHKESFFELVFEVARQIPRGRVTSYGAIAACLGARSSSRMVGWAMNGADRVHPKIPAHRVVNRNGMLSGKHHFATPTRMQELLEKEGIQVKNDTVVEFRKLFWDPSEEFY